MADVEDGFVDISVEQDGSLLKKVLREGEGEATPESGNDVWVHYVGTLQSDGSKFDASRDRGREFEFQVGVGQVIRAWDVGICTMRRGELCTLRAKSNYAYGEEGSPPTIPGGATLDFEVELFRWRERAPEPHSMKSDEERSAHALKQKDAGNAAIKAQDWATAVELYATGLQFVEFNGGAGAGGGGHSHGGVACSGHHGGDAGDQELELSDEDQKLYVALLSNSAMAHLKLKEPGDAATKCSKALALDADNVKLLYRRGQARIELGDWAMAIEDAGRILALDPANADAEKLKQSATARERAAKKQEKAMYGKMFG